MTFMLVFSKAIFFPGTFPLFPYARLLCMVSVNGFSGLYVHLDPEVTRDPSFINRLKKSAEYRA